MKEVIDKLVEIEDTAKNIIENATNEKVEIERAMQAKKKEYEKSLKEERERKLSELKDKLAGEMGPQIEEIYKKGNEYLSEMENRFVTDKEKMADEVVQRIIGA